MSNYLSHLVAKNLNQVETVQPRPISRFEPQSGVVNPPTGFVIEEAEHPGDRARNHSEVASSAEQRESSQPDRSNPPAETSHAPSTRPPRQNEPLFTQPSALNRVQSEPLSFLDLPHWLRSASPVSASPDRSSTVVQPSSIPEAGHNPDAASVSAVGFALPLDFRQGSVQFQSNLVSQSNSAQTRESVPSPSPLSPNPEVRQNWDHPSARIMGQPLQPLQPQSLVTNLPVPNPPTPTESAPTIQVSIGRIEVRATPSKPASPKPRSMPSAMSLSDYLDQRARRER